MAKVIIAEQSHIIAAGFLSLLKGFKEIEEVRVVYNTEDCYNLIEEFTPSVLLINTSFMNEDEMSQLLYSTKQIQVLYVFNTSLPLDSPLSQLSILDSKSTLVDKLTKVLAKNIIAKDDDTEELSPREKLILKHVALGLTNKEIAEKAYISTHTVISHRKNITRKLSIKTVSGLTVYAILNNIIQMDDIS